MMTRIEMGAVLFTDEWHKMGTEMPQRDTPAEDGD